MFLIKTDLKDSGIHGLGIFAKEKKEKGEAVWWFDPLFDLMLRCEKEYPHTIMKNLVIDTKYKIVNSFPIGDKDDKNQISHGDIYQMFAYCKALNLKNGVLLYPKHFGHNFKAQESLTLVDGVAVTARFLDLGGESNFESYIQKQKQQLTRLTQ